MIDYLSIGSSVDKDAQAICKLQKQQIYLFAQDLANSVGHCLKYHASRFDKRVNRIFDMLKDVAIASSKSEKSSYTVHMAAGAASLITEYNQITNKKNYGNWDWIYNLWDLAYNKGRRLPKHWKNSTTISLATDFIDNKNPDVLPILADALEEIGCNDTNILIHLRTKSSLQRPSNWIIYYLTK